MNLLNHHEKCLGIVLFKWRQRFVQLWLCPSGYKIQKHSHPEEDIELMYIFGSSVFYRLTSSYVFTEYQESYKPKWYHIFRCFSVPAGTIHWFEVSKWPLVFINFSTFKDNIKPKSAAIDFKL